MPPRAPKKIFATRGFTHLDPSSVPMRTLRAERRPTAALEATALAHVDGTRTIEEIAAKLSLSGLEAATVIARLVELGCVTIGTSASDDSQDRPTLVADDPSLGGRSVSGKQPAAQAPRGRARSS